MGSRRSNVNADASEMSVRTNHSIVLVAVVTPALMLVRDDWH
jgi:hypothetical protein